MDRLLVDEIYNLLFGMHTGLSGILPGMHASIETCTCSLAETWRKVSKHRNDAHSGERLANILDAEYRQCSLVAGQFDAIIQTIKIIDKRVGALEKVR